MEATVEGKDTVEGAFSYIRTPSRIRYEMVCMSLAGKSELKLWVCRHRSSAFN
jgi:hypothetical protein